MPAAWHVGGGRVELLLLSGDSEDERRDRDHHSVHRAGLGAAVYGRSRIAGADGAEDFFRRSRGGGKRAGDRGYRPWWIALQHARDRGGDAGGVFLRLL